MLYLSELCTPSPMWGFLFEMRCPVCFSCSTMAGDGRLSSRCPFLLTLDPCWPLLSTLSNAPWNRHQAEHWPVDSTRGLLACTSFIVSCFLCKLGRTIFTLQSIQVISLLSSPLWQQALCWMLNCLVECYSVPWYVFTELQAHFEPASETEGVDKDTEVEGDYPLVDLLSQEVHVTPRGTRPGSVAIQEGQPHQQDPSLQLSKLRQETNRSGPCKPCTRLPGKECIYSFSGSQGLLPFQCQESSVQCLVTGHTYIFHIKKHLSFVIIEPPAWHVAQQSAPQKQLKGVGGNIALCRQWCVL